jgi:hypothetical protein
VRGAALAACLALAACGSAPEKSEWERAHESQLAPAEAPLVFPPYPREAELIPFEAGAPREVRFFIVSRSIEIGADSVVRYTLVARSAAGAQIVTSEGMRCSTGEVRIFARSSDGKLRVAVADTGAGLSESSGSGVGLANIRARLSTLYAGSARLLLAQNPEGGVTATIEIPATEPAHAVRAA